MLSWGVEAETEAKWGYEKQLNEMKAGAGVSGMSGWLRRQKLTEEEWVIARRNIQRGNEEAQQKENMETKHDEK